MLTAGTMIEGAFGLVRERPRAVALWGVLYMIATIIMALAMRPMLEAQMAAMAGDPQAALGTMGSMMGRMFMLQFGFLLLFVILMTAAQRAVLRPAEQASAYIRLGGDEARIFGLTLLFAIGFYLALVLLGIVAALFAAGAGAAMGPWAAGAVGVILFIAVFAVVVWLQVRLSLAFPLTVLRRKFVIGESWRRTRGHFWSLFGGYVVIFVIVLVMLIIAGLVTSGSYFGSLIANANNPAGMQQAMMTQMEQQYGSISAMTIVGWVVSAAAGAIMIALFGGSAASAAKALVAEESVAETFA
ncbi:glycerophosphoryl diester phosphodiesterase membrane domain-containing protein [Allosphingosinicella deserti]|uniref:Glycerophosphoryl diester phosphodiesterase membrane domain-containing protein n=1 Tax=Allosphingosinicella deserti TaxID=2116704 RepID=A0A2P7QR60_9SPHN|nr:glycerophosphoryl diester phosphodiesterase membrane domain-containing protein [Sphingomonas deserti]PSJ40455.1 hypothetical protein C7I55_08955 [Sphingomonas deserti]